MLELMKTVRKVVSHKVKKKSITLNTLAITWGKNPEDMKRPFTIVAKI